MKDGFQLLISGHGKHSEIKFAGKTEKGQIYLCCCFREDGNYGEMVKWDPFAGFDNKA